MLITTTCWAATLGSVKAMGSLKGANCITLLHCLKFATEFSSYLRKILKADQTRILDFIMNLEFSKSRLAFKSLLLRFSSSLQNFILMLQREVFVKLCKKAFYLMYKTILTVMTYYVSARCWMNSVESAAEAPNVWKSGSLFLFLTYQLTWNIECHDCLISWQLERLLNFFLCPDFSLFCLYLWF